MIDYSKILSSTVTEIKPSGIRKFFDIAATMDDVISLGVGEPDFQTPWSVRKAGIASLEKGKTKYTSNSGLLELRKEISNTETLDGYDLMCMEYDFESLRK